MQLIIIKITTTQEKTHYDIFQTKPELDDDFLESNDKKTSQN